MSDFTSIKELSYLKGSEPVLEKINEITAFLREKEADCKFNSHPFFVLDFDKKTLSFSMAISIPWPS
jgi:hypothetical protein